MPFFAEVDGLTGLIGYILAGFAVLSGTVALLYRELMARTDAVSKDQKIEIADLKSKVKSLESVADEGRETALQIANWYRKKYEDKPPIVPLVPVVPEANSPSTEKQRIESRIATLRAGMAEIRKETGLEPRATPPEAVEGKQAFPPPLSVSQSQEIKAAVKGEADKRLGLTVSEALGVKEQILTIPEKTAAKVIEKLKE